MWSLIWKISKITDTGSRKPLAGGRKRASIMPGSSKCQRERERENGTMDLDQILVAFVIATAVYISLVVSYFSGNNLPAQKSQLSKSELERK